MAGSALTKEEGWGLAISIAGHAALLTVLLLRPASDNVVIPPERVEVTISEEVGLKSVSPEPSAIAAPDEAPDIGEAAPAPEPAPALLPPQPAARVIEPPRPPAPRPVVKPEPRKPEPRKLEVRKPEPRKPPRPSAIDRIARASPATSKPATLPKKPGGTRFADSFKPGTPGASNAEGSGAPAATIGPKQISALNAAINRQLKPKWQGKAPEGADAELLETYVTFNLNRDGTLAGSPQVIRQSGITESNRAQAQRHAEQAVRAIQLAQPFNLPPQYYDAWKRVVEFRFDRKLSQ